MPSTAVWWRVAVGVLLLVAGKALIQSVMPCPISNCWTISFGYGCDS